MGSERKGTFNRTLSSLPQNRKSDAVRDDEGGEIVGKYVCAALFNVEGQDTLETFNHQRVNKRKITDTGYPEHTHLVKMEMALLNFEIIITY